VAQAIWVPLDKSEVSVKGKELPVPEHRFFAREVEDQDSGNLTLRPG